MKIKNLIENKKLASGVILALALHLTGFCSSAEFGEENSKIRKALTGLTFRTAPLKIPTLAPLIKEPPSKLKTEVPASLLGSRRRLYPMLQQISAAVRRSSLPSLFDSGAKRTGPQATTMLAGAIVRSKGGPLKLRHGVAKVAPALRVPEAGSHTRRYFQVSDYLTARHEEPITIEADPKDTTAVEQSIRKLFVSNPEIFGLTDTQGNRVLTNDNLALVHIMPVEKSNTLHAVFRQVQKGTREDGRPYYLQVYGASLSLTFKIEDGHMILKAYDGRFYPIQVDMTPRFSNGILQSVAEQRLMPATTTSRFIEQFRSRVLKPLRLTSKFEGRRPELLNRQIIPDDKGKWHAANIYQGADLNGRPVNIGVDVATGEVFAWDAHGMFLHPKRPETLSPTQPTLTHFAKPEGTQDVATPLSVDVLGRGNTLLHGDDHGPINTKPMPHLKVHDPQGRLLGITDENGRLTLPDGGTIEIATGLEGEYATVHDDNAENRPLKIIKTLAPGEPNRAVINPVSDSPELVGQINSYLGWTRLLQWMKSIGVNDKRVDQPLAIHNNKMDMPCNAYYDPMSDTLNLESEDDDCENSAQPSILLHESGHRFVEFFARINGDRLRTLAARVGLPHDAFEFLAQGFDFIMGGGVNEGTADTISMYFRDNPKIGEGFFKHPGPGMPLVLRDGRNIRPYRPGEVHDEGETLMGATWEIYDEIKNILGEAAGAAYASAVVIPTLIFSQPKDVPAAMAQILLAVTQKDSNSPIAAIVRRAAQRREIPLPDALSGHGNLIPRQPMVHPA